jgi:chromate transporter
MKKSGNALWHVFISFFKIGAFTFGGGYAMIPLIQKEAVEKRKWVTDEDILDIIAIAESTPGPIAINSATFVGYRAAGVLGSVCATMGVVLPSFVIILTISFLLQQFQQLQVVRYAFQGIRAGVLALLVKSLWSMYQKNQKNWASYLVMAASFVLTAFFGVNVLFVIIGCAVFGVVSARYMERGQQK